MSMINNLLWLGAFADGGSGGGSGTETVLWRNERGSQPFDKETNIVSAETARQYRALKLIYRPSTEINTPYSFTKPVSEIFPEVIEDVYSCGMSITANGPDCPMTRLVYITNDGEYLRVAGRALPLSEGTGTSADVCIPLFLYGIN